MNKINTPNTILLVGEPRGGKSLLLKWIANVLRGNDIEHYDLDIVGEARSPHLYEISSVNGTLVSTRVFSEMRRHDRFVRFVSSTHLDSPTILSEMRPTKRVL